MKITWLILIMLLSLPILAAESPSADDRYEIFAVFPRPLAIDEKFSVLLDKRTGRMWTLEKEFFSIEGHEQMAQEIVWRPIRKFESDSDFLAWQLKYSKALKEANQSK